VAGGDYEVTMHCILYRLFVAVPNQLKIQTGTF